MAELGAMANLVGIVGFVSQITQACVYLAGLIGDIKDAPTEVRNLRTEVDLVSISVSRLQTIYEQINQSSTAITNPVHELQHCEKAVTALTASLKKSLTAFDNRASAKMTKRSWDRSKYALGKENTQEKLDALSRARQSLLTVQSNMQLIQGIFTITMPKAVEIFLAPSSKSREALPKLTIACITWKGLGKHQKELYETSTATLARVSAARPVLDHVSSNTTDTLASVGRIENGFSRLGYHVSATSLVSAQSNQDLKRDVLQQIDIGFSRQADTQAQAHPRFLAGIAQLLEVAFEKERRARASDCSIYRNEATEPNLKESDRASAASAITRRGFKKYKIATQTTYRTPLGDIVIQTLKPDEKSHTPQDTTSIKKIELRMRLGIFNRGFQFTQTWRKNDPFSELSLRTRNIIHRKGRAAQSVKDWDLDSVKNMFETGEASIFDITQNGEDYPYLCLDNIIGSRYTSAQDCLNFGPCLTTSLTWA